MVMYSCIFTYECVFYYVLGQRWPNKQVKSFYVLYQYFTDDNLQRVQTLRWPEVLNLRCNILSNIIHWQT